MRPLAASFPEWLPLYLGGFQELFDILQLTSGFVLIPVEVPGPDVARVLSEWLSRRGVPVALFEPRSEAEWEDLAGSILRSPPPPSDGVVMVIGSRTTPPGLLHGLRLINQRRDTIARHLGRPLLWSGPTSFLDTTWNNAPDFWSVRAVEHRVAAQNGAKDALEPLRDLLRAAREQGDVRNEARLAVQLVDDLTAAGALDEAAILVRETFERARSGPVEVWGDLAVRNARLLLARDEGRAAIEEMSSLLLARSLPESVERDALLVLGAAHAKEGHPREARAAYEKALSSAIGARDAGAEIQARIGVGVNAAGPGGSLQEASASIEAALEKAREIGDAELEVQALRALAQVSSRLYDEAGAKELLVQALGQERPQYASDETFTLAMALSDARAKRAALVAAGERTREIDAEILALRRKMREGGQLRAGDSLGNDRFLLLRRIGRGGFASVWEAQDRRRDERVAVKVLHAALAEDTTRRERFFRGARIMAELVDEAVVRVIEPYGEDGGFYYFVMELLPGGDFRDAVLNHQMSPDRALAVVLIIAGALARAHARRIVHRDVKPGNILLDALGAPKLGDFDLVAAQETTGGTHTGAMGTFMYAAPEILTRPQDADARADVFGLGMTAIFGLHGDNLPSIALRDANRMIGTLPCGVAVKKVLSKAVAWDPEERYPDAGIFAAALRQAISTETTAEKHESPTISPSVSDPDDLPPALAREEVLPSRIGESTPPEPDAVLAPGSPPQRSSASPPNFEESSRNDVPGPIGDPTTASSSRVSARRTPGVIAVDESSSAGTRLARSGRGWGAFVAAAVAFGVAFGALAVAMWGLLTPHGFQVPNSAGGDTGATPSSSVGTTPLTSFLSTGDGDDAGAPSSSGTLSKTEPFDCPPGSQYNPRSGVCVDVFPVTLPEYRECIAAGICPTFQSATCALGSGFNASVLCVDWVGAIAYCQWVHKSLPRMRDLGPPSSVPWLGGLAEWTLDLAGREDGGTMAWVAIQAGASDARTAYLRDVTERRPDVTERRPDVTFRCVKPIPR